MYFTSLGAVGGWVEQVLSCVARGQCSAKVLEDRSEGYGWQRDVFPLDYTLCGQTEGLTGRYAFDVESGTTPKTYPIRSVTDLSVNPIGQVENWLEPDEFTFVERANTWVASISDFARNLGYGAVAYPSDLEIHNPRIVSCTYDGHTRELPFSKWLGMECSTGNTRTIGFILDNLTDRPLEVEVILTTEDESNVRETLITIEPDREEYFQYSWHAQKPEYDSIYLGLTDPTEDKNAITMQYRQDCELD